MGMKIKGLDSAMLLYAKAGPAMEDKAKKALQGGAKRLKAAFQERLSQQNVSGRSKHELEKSLKIDPVKYDPGRGYYTKVHPDGVDSSGQPLPLIANVLEYGRSGGKGCYPWMQPTVEAEKDAIREEIRAALLEDK